jgi:uncharacterized membrane protein YedE/YeeE
MTRGASAYLAGLIFGLGLVVSGMTDPVNVVGFLDFGGLTAAWNPALIGVMGGAVLTHGLLLRWLERRQLAPAATAPDLTPAPSQIDRRLLIGAATFGVGWGLSGYCPGPAIVSLGFGPGRAWLFVAAVIVGGFVADAVRARHRAARPGALGVSVAGR